MHNRCQTTLNFVQCLKRQIYQDFHLVLIDDGSVDGTAQMVREQFEDLTVIQGDGHWWWAGSLQQGYRWLLENAAVSERDAVLIINDDTEFADDFLAIGMRALARHCESLVLATCYSRQTGRIFDAGVRVDWSRYSFQQAESPEAINCLSTRGLFLTVGDFRRIGGFYPLLLPHYLSDYEFTVRAKRKGKKLLVDADLKLWVDESMTGYREYFKDPFWLGVRKLFSKRCLRNPLARSAFIALACPWRWKLICFLRVWFRTGREIMTLLKN